MADQQELAERLRACSKELALVAELLQGREEPAPAITLEIVREVAVEKARAGFTEDVRELLVKHGAERLSLLKEEEYGAFFKELEGIGHAG